MQPARSRHLEHSSWPDEPARQLFVLRVFCLALSPYAHLVIYLRRHFALDHRRPSLYVGFAHRRNDQEWRATCWEVDAARKGDGMPNPKSYQLVLKRSFDIVVSLVALSLFFPFLLLVALIIRSDGGPVLHRSQRIGRGSLTFDALKLRTMVPNAEAVLQNLIERDPNVRREWYSKFKLKHDPRITAIGRFLRKSSLDEVPQLWNVLRGEMSLVGPRPMLLDEIGRQDAADLDLYYQVRPGLTGLWQVSGRDNLDYAERAVMNTWYIRHWSFTLDLAILAKTAVVVPLRAYAS